MNSSTTSEIVGCLLRVEIVQRDGNEPKVSVVVTPESGRRLLNYGSAEGAKDTLSTLLIEIEKALEWLDAEHQQSSKDLEDLRQ